MTLNDFVILTATTLLTVASIQTWPSQIGDGGELQRSTQVERQLAHVTRELERIEKSRVTNTKRMLDVSVSIKTVSHVRIDKLGDSIWESGSGSGFLVSSKDCIVWTNHHVVKDAALVQVYPREWRRTAGIPATVVNSTPRFDLAILRMKACKGIPEARLGDSGLVKPGDETYAVGNPLGRNPDSISRGIISHTTRYFSGVTPYLQTDAAINPGSSGGALFNRNGEVIGINTAIASTLGSGNIGIGYAIPINSAKRVAARLLKAPPSWGDAGIGDVMTSLTPDEAEVFRVPHGFGAIIITDDPKNGPAAGKLFAHDVIFKINGTGITDAEQALRTISSYRAKDTLTLHLVRTGRVTSVDITLAEGWKPDERKPPEHFEGYLGMTLEMWRGEDGEKGSFQTPVITKVQSLGPAHAAQISSSQSAIGMRGSLVFPYMIDVKTVTGVVYDGLYHAVTNVSDVSHFASQAFRTGAPLLLEIELWARLNPMNYTAELKRMGTGFFKVVPKATTAPSHSVGDRRDGRPVTNAVRPEIDHPSINAGRAQG